MPKHHSIVLLFAFLSLFSFSACSYDMEIRGVEMQPYHAVEVPRLFDKTMTERRNDGVLLAGVNVVDVTPYDRKAWIAGFGPGRKSMGVLDPVTARILYLDDGHEAVVFIVFDLVGMMNNDIRRLRAMITENYGRRIQVICTHNHSGPDPIGFWGPGLLIPVDRGVDEDWLAKTFQAVALGVNDAIKTAEPVRVAFGYQEVSGEWSTNLWFPHDQSPIDRNMSVFRLEKADGKPLATVINWACHAESLLDRGRKISADWPGRFYQANQKRGNGTGIVLPGSLGGMITAYPCRWEERKHYRKLEARYDWATKLGEKLVDVSEEALRDAPRLTEARLRLTWSDIKVPMENTLFRIVVDNGILKLDQRDYEENVFSSEISALDFGPATFAFVPGEPFPSLGKQLKEAMPWAKPPFVVGLTNDELAYMMTPEEWEDSHYSYERSMSCGPQTGELVVGALKNLLARRN